MMSLDHACDNEEERAEEEDSIEAGRDCIIEMMITMMVTLKGCLDGWLAHVLKSGCWFAKMFC